jgi:ketosteroid isomerase-like protein
VPDGSIDPVSAATLATIERFNTAFNNHDVPAIMSLMTDDCVFEHETVAGREALKDKAA